MGILDTALQLAKNDDVVKAAMAAFGAIAGWTAKWLQGRDRYQAHVAWQSIYRGQGPEDVPFLFIQNVDTRPINISNIRIVDGFGRAVRGYVFDSPDPDYPSWPILVKTHDRASVAIDVSKLIEAADRSWPLLPFYVPRVRIKIYTLGRWTKTVSAETGLPWDKRRRRYR